MAYTYILEWTKLGKRYIGARWAADCKPSDLWTEYFTSSIYVRAFVAEHGDPDIILIDKVFSSAQDAMKREQELQRQFDVRHNEAFLNKAVAGVWDHSDPDVRRKLSEAARGRKHTPEWVAWVTEFHRTRKRSAETSAKISASLTGKKLSEEHKQKNRIAALGHRHTSETKEKMSQKRKGNKHRLGTTQSEKTRALMSEQRKGRIQTSVTCPHCGKTGGNATMPRWHFDNCKLKD
jgi:NUMOD3 motif